ncbi:GGDEF domain-containing protein [Clostridium sp.]|uniref:GGDEF domain-containing protein n=1 Tax=Clostridium sp. TaxID=1506 RepID=UPI003D6CB549
MNRFLEKTNIYFILLFLDLFCVMNFLGFNFPNNNLENSIIIGILFTVIIISYFLGPIVGLLSSTVIIFFYGTFKLYVNLSFNSPVALNTYVWMLFIPLSSFITGMLSDNIHKLQDDNEKLSRDYKNLVTIDSETGLNNIKGFYMNLNKQLSFSRRHKTPLTLMIVKLHYFDDLKAILGNTKLTEILLDISSCINDATRNEDERYKLNEDVFAILMSNTDFKGSEIVKLRIKENLTNLTFKANEKGKNVNLETKIGALELNDNISDSFEFKELAEKELEYDV